MPATMSLSVHSITRISAVRKENGGSSWVDLQFHNYYGAGEITLFPADHADPRFSALAEFIAETWPEDKPVEAAPAVDESEMPF